jgi:hypothetical protein
MSAWTPPPGSSGAGAEGRAQHTTRLTDTQRAIYQALKVAPPPPVATLDPA